MSLPIGKTPLIKLQNLSRETGCTILGKAEFLNPGGSVKDRAAKGIIEDAEARGLLKPGSIIVEGTAGNTGIGLVSFGNTRGYRSIIVVPNTQSKEKIDALRALGAEVRLVPPAPYSEPGNYNHIAREIAENTPGGFWANQFDNTANRREHERTTGPEIFEATQGRLDGFVAAVGTGGTLAGVSLALKERSSAIRTVCVDPHGASIYHYIKSGELREDDGDSVTEGIGQARLTANLKGAPIDDAYRIGDRLIFEMLDHLAQKEGLILGSSSAINVCGAAKLARELGPGHTIVTILCDSGVRYLSKIFNEEWRKNQDLPLSSVSNSRSLKSLLEDLDREC